MLACVWNPWNFFILHWNIWLSYIKSWMISSQLKIFWSEFCTFTDFRIVIWILVHTDSMVGSLFIWISCRLIPLIRGLIIRLKRLKFLNYLIILVELILILIIVLIFMVCKILILLGVLILIDELLKIFIQWILFNYHIFLVFHYILPQ
jgi:hypothetical protein